MRSHSLFFSERHLISHLEPITRWSLNIDSCSQPFGIPGKKKSCFSHCELLVHLDNQQQIDDQCNIMCSKMGIITRMTNDPCRAMGACPLPLAHHTTTKLHSLDTNGRHFRPVVIIRGEPATMMFTDALIQWIQLSFPSIHVRDLELTNAKDPTLEQAYGILRPLHSQVERVCELLENDINLLDGCDIVGIGRGGLIARGFVEQCNTPQVHNLITYNTPHGGISDGAGLPHTAPWCTGCLLIMDPLLVPLDCVNQARVHSVPDALRSADSFMENVRSLGSPYDSEVQEMSSEAGYFRDPERLDTYREMASFLPDINLERDNMEESDKFVSNIKKLKKLVSVCSGDSWPIPKASCFFESEAADGYIPKLWQTKIYETLGLQALDLSGRLILKEAKSCTFEQAEGRDWIKLAGYRPDPSGKDELDKEDSDTFAHVWTYCRREVYDHILDHLGTVVTPSQR